MLTQEQIQAAADRIAAALHPKKIILFGSYARGDANEHSDLDLMVVAPKSTKIFDAMVKGRRAAGNMGIGVDVIVFSANDFAERSEWCSSAAYWAAREGRVLYEA